MIKRLMSLSRIKRNVLANLAAGAWASVLALVCIPLYLKYLGIEAYGLIGIFATLMAVFGIMDLGLGATLNRGLARLSVHPESLGEQRDLLRTLELIYWTGATTIGLLTFALAGPLAARWVHPQNLSPASVASAVRLMGIVAALQLPFALYQAGLMGLQRQVLLNAVLIVTTTLRTVGAVAVLAFISPTVNAFFMWQAFVTIAQTGTTVLMTWRALAAPSAPKFQRVLLRQEWRFAAGISANALIGIFLTQSDKILLSGIVPLAEFGYYVLAGTVAATLWWVIGPINAGLFPRFAQLIELGDDDGLRKLYHTACQCVAAIILPIAATLVFFSRTIVFIWTHNSVTAERSAVVIALLVTGTCFNGLASVPAYVQAAAGWPQLTMYTNLVCAVLLVPGILFLGLRYGAPGAASVWVVVNLVYVLVTVPIMHRRLLIGEKWRWYSQDVLIPLAAVLAVGVLARLAYPATLTRVTSFLYVACAGMAMATAAMAATPLARGAVLQTIRRAPVPASGEPA